MTDPISISENELLERIKAGDEAAFIQLYRDRQMAIHRFALQMSGSPSIAEDVTQEVFLALIREVRRFDPARGPLSAYLYGMARNMVLDHLRKGRMDVSLEEFEAPDSRASEARVVATGDPLGDLTRGEAVESLRKAILALPEHYREVVVLCDLNEMNYDHAAAALGCAIGTVRSRLHRAREILLKRLTTKKGSEKQAGEMKPLRCAL
jgi:RNA polymerase sigma-70 factor (ECF subfamily)